MNDNQIKLYFLEDKITMMTSSSSLCYIFKKIVETLFRNKVFIEQNVVTLLKFQ